MNRPNYIDCKVLDPKAVVPARHTPGAAGFDLAVLDHIGVPPGEMRVLRTGIAIALPQDTVGRIVPRSSSVRLGLYIDGTIDSDYRGELLLQVRNVGRAIVHLEAGQRIAQLLVVRLLPDASIIEVPVLGETERGERGFGSTGR